MFEYRVLGPVVAAVCLLAGATFWLRVRLRVSPAERERKRRLLIGREGRLAHGMVTEIHDAAIFYAYTIRGVSYMASQDIGDLRGAMPAEEARLIGPVMLKYARQNPANSIVICEEWSGLPSARPS
jgi:hypothetical protein